MSRDDIPRSEPGTNGSTPDLNGSTPTLAQRDVDEVYAVRTLVPSEREGGQLEQEAQTALEPHLSLSETFEGDHPSKKKGVGGYFQQFDVRTVTGGGPKMPLIMIGYLSLVFQLDGQAFGLLVPEIKRDFGFSIAFLSSVGVIVTWVSVMVAPVMGYIADRVRRVTMLAVGAVISHLAIALTGFVGSVPQLIGARLLGGAGGSIRGPVGFPLLTDYYPPSSRARAFAFIQLTGTAGAIAGPFVAGAVGSALGWRTTLKLFGLVAALISLAFFWLREPIRGQQDRMAAGLSEEMAAEEPRPLGWTEGWRAAWSIRTLRRICYATPFVSLASMQLALFLNLYYTQKFHLGPLQRGIILSISALPAVAGLMMSATITDRLLAYRPGRVLNMLAGIVSLSAVGLGVLVFTPYLWLAILVNMIPSFFAALIEPAVTTTVSLVVPARIRGLGLQVPAPFALLGLLLAPVVGAYADANGIDAAILFLIPILLIGAIIFGTAGGGVEEDIRMALAAGVAEREAREAAAAGETKTLVCRDVDVTFDGAQVLFGVDFDVTEGEFVALLGTNGAGKSTLLRAIAGIHPASNGAIFLDGDDITHLPPELVAARGVVMMPGGQAVFPRMTVAKNLRAAAWMTREDEDHVKQKTEEILQRFPRLRERLNAQAGNLSGGEQQMLAIGQALLMKPRLLMIDELSLGLAPQIVQELLETLQEINLQGTTIIIVEQSINVALQVATRAVFMEKGQVRFDGRASDLRSQPGVVRSVFLSGAVTASDLGRASAGRFGIDEPENVLTVDAVNLRYGGVQVLNDVSLSVAQGEIVGLVGANGAGKTSLFDVITGFAPIEGGSVELAGRNITRLPPDARARLGLARSYQNVRLFPALTVKENIAVALERHLQSRSAVLAAVWSPITRRSERRVARRVDNLVESLGLGGFANKFLNELSTGTRRIVDIACLLAAQPRVLLLDEPSSGLAQAETEILGPVIARIQKETGCAIIIIEHDLGLVASVSDRLVAMRLGEILVEGPPGDVLADPDVIASLTGGASEAIISRSVKLSSTRVGLEPDAAPKS